MTHIEQMDVVKSKLDLREGWVMVKSFDEAKEKISSGEAQSCYWYDESGNFVSTLTDLAGLKEGQMLSYDVSKTEVLLPGDSDELGEKMGKGALQKNILNALKKYRIYVDFRCEVKDSDEAYRRAAAGEKKKFWMIDKESGKVRILDFSEGEKPYMEEYPLEETSINYYTVEL